MGPGLVELSHPEVEVGLEVLDRLVELLAEGDAIKLVEHGLVEALDDAVGLRALGLGSGVVDVLDREIELVFVAVVGSAIFGPPVGQHQGNVVLLVERDHPVVEQVGGGERGLAVVEFGEADLGLGGVGVDEGLLVDAPDALQRPDVEGVLGAAVSRAFGDEFDVVVGTRSDGRRPEMDRVRLLVVVRRRSISPLPGAWRQGTFASASWRHTLI